MSTATEASLNSTSHNRKSLDSADHLIQPLVDAAHQSLYGEDVWLGCFIGNMDSWYERNVLLATHNLLRIIPSVSVDTEEYYNSCCVITFFYVNNCITIMVRCCYKQGSILSFSKWFSINILLTGSSLAALGKYII